MPKKGVVPPHLRRFLFRKKKSGRTTSTMTRGTRMARRARVRRSFRRIRVRRPRKMTALKAMKWGIALSGPAYFTYRGWKEGGIEEALVRPPLAYTGYHIRENKFYMQHLAVGWVPLVGAWLFGKFASRVLR